MASKSTARNLKKHQLGGVIFGCTSKTMKECLGKQLFGLPSQHWSYVKNIEPRLPLFLFNYSDRTMHGIYEAASPGKQYIDSYAWTEDGSERTRYPAQVQIITRMRCQGLPENQFKSIIIDNYYNTNHFWFELDHAQARTLLSKLSTLAVVSRVVIPRNPPIWKGAQKLPSESKHEESRAAEPYLADDVVHSVGTSCKWGDLMNNNHSVEPSLSNGVAGNDDNEFMYMKLKQLAIDRDCANANMNECAVDAATGDSVELRHQNHEAAVMNSGKSNSENSLDSNYYPDIISKLCREIEELKTFKQEQTRRIECLERKLTEAEQEIHCLDYRCMMLESPDEVKHNITDEDRHNITDEVTHNIADEVMHNIADEVTHNIADVVTHNITDEVTHNIADEVTHNITDEVTHNIKESILLIGGYDGLSWSSALDAFLPSHDHLKSLKPMSGARAYTAVARINHELYVLGGGCQGPEWYDTVESYDILNDKWRRCPSLWTGTGCLSSAALNGKIFALGGGNGSNSFSDVRMLDLDVGCWIHARSMIQKRFALGAVELNGAVYAVGGYDGKEYLRSAERFDPREHSWTRIRSMDTKRGCHSLAVINEKIYAIGGCDGKEMVASMEIYDPRADAWMAGEPMRYCRGYLSAAVLNETIYAIGGVKESEKLVKTIEVYKEGQGWQATNLGSVGERCFCSAIVI